MEINFYKQSYIWHRVIVDSNVTDSTNQLFKSIYNAPEPPPPPTKFNWFTCFIRDIIHHSNYNNGKFIIIYKQEAHGSCTSLTWETYPSNKQVWARLCLNIRLVKGAIIFPSKGAGSFFWINTNLLHLKMLCIPSFVEIWQVVLQKNIFKCHQYILAISLLSPLGKERGPSIKQA